MCGFPPDHSVQTTCLLALIVIRKMVNGLPDSGNDSDELPARQLAKEEVAMPERPIEVSPRIR